MTDDQPPDPYGLTSAHWDGLTRCAVIAGWQTARARGVSDPDLSDAIAWAAVDAVRERMMEWHAQDPVRHPATTRHTHQAPEDSQHVVLAIRRLSDALEEQYPGEFVNPDDLRVLVEYARREVQPD